MKIKKKGIFFKDGHFLYSCQALEKLLSLKKTLKLSFLYIFLTWLQKEEDMYLSSRNSKIYLNWEKGEAEREGMGGIQEGGKLRSR